VQLGEHPLKTVNTWGGGPLNTSQIPQLPQQEASIGKMSQVKGIDSSRVSCGTIVLDRYRRLMVK